MPPVEAALRDAGGFTEDTVELVSGAPAIARAVVSCRVSMAWTGESVLGAFALDVNEESSLSAVFLEDDRARWATCDAGGGGGKAGPRVAFGESIKPEGLRG